MPSGDPTFYKLTVRPHRSEDGRYEYVLSRSGSDPVRSIEAYETYKEAKDAGNKLGEELGLKPALSTANP